MRQPVSMRCMIRKAIGFGNRRVAGVLQFWVERCTVRGMRELLAKSHDNIFRVVSRGIVTRLRAKLRESIDMLVLCLLGVRRVDTGRRGS